MAETPGQDLDAAFRAMERLRPVRLFDFTGGIGNAMLSGELSIGVLHDTAVSRHQERVPVDILAPPERIIAPEQVLPVTEGTQMTELANAWIN